VALARAERLLELAHLLHGRKAWTVAALARRFEVSPRTIERDLAELETSRVPLEPVGNGWRLAGSKEPSPVLLTAYERALLRLAIGHPALRRGLALARALDALAVRLGAASPEAARRSPVLELAAAGRSGPVSRPIFETLARAADEHRTCRVVYDSAAGGARRSRELDPYRLFLRGPAWYLAAWCHENGDVRIFRLDRFEAITALDRTFEPPARSDVESYLAQAAEPTSSEGRREVVVRFDADLRPLLAGGGHWPSEAFEELHDGSFEYRVRDPDLDAFARWIVTFAGKAEVLEPQELKTRVRFHAYAVLQRYETIDSREELEEVLEFVVEAVRQGVDLQTVFGSALLAELAASLPDDYDPEPV
jgi:predicted DNA-binding transcriptional regulator YafY